MKYVKKQLLFLFLFGFGFVPVQAQQTPPLTLSECLQLAAQHSFQVQSQQAQVMVAEQQASLVRAGSIPKISGELGGEGRFLGGYNFGQEWVTVQADWALGDFFKKTSLAARQDVLTQRYRTQQQQLEAMGNAAVLYIGILQTQKALQLLGIRIKLMQRHALLAHSMWKAGLRTQLDVLQTQTQLSKLQEDSVKLTMNNENLRNTLALRLGWKSGDSLHVLSLNTKSITKTVLPPINKAEVSKNLMIKMLQSKIAAQELRVKNVEANRYPHLVVGGGWFADGDPTGDGNYWLINAGIRIPIYEGKSVKLAETASLAQKESLQYQLQNIQRETIIKTNRLTKKMNKLREMMKIQTNRKQTLQQSSQFAEVNFKAGLITNLEYLDIQQKLTDAELKLEQSRLIFAMNLIDYYVVTNQTAKILEMGK